MNAPGKKKFLRDLTGAVLKSALESVAKMPEHWDGVELRIFLAEKFSEQMTATATRQRIQACRDEIASKGL